MNRARSAALFALAACALLAGGCSGRKFKPLAPLSDAPVIATVRRQNLAQYDPGYGISTMETGRLEFAVNIEAGDTPSIFPGQAATAYVAPSSAPIHCRVARILRRASAETGQSIAWLSPIGKADVPVGNFVDARILVGVRKDIVAVPPSSVLFKEGHAWVIRVEAPQSPSEKTRYVPTSVALGEVTDEAVEIKSGLAVGDKIVVQGGIGYLYPNFKAEADD